MGDDVEQPGQVSCQVTVPGDHLRDLLGQQDAHARLIEAARGVRVLAHDGYLEVRGEAAAAQGAAEVLRTLAAAVAAGHEVSATDVRYALDALERSAPQDAAALLAPSLALTARGTPVRPRTAGQARFVEAAGRNSLVFCVGPAGTGKTYLAMALAVAALREKQISRIVLTRPIIEAGERLGFLPGDILEKVEPYLRPLYDALHDLLGPDKLQRHRQRGTIEVVPLAYMRGRTVNDACLVLDEAQNTTPAQMKMALTRMGLGSRMIVTGDPTQSDLPEGQESGLQHALRVLTGIRGLEVCRLTEADIVRHDLVQRIVRAYEAAEAGNSSAPVST